MLAKDTNNQLNLERFVTTKDLSNRLEDICRTALVPEVSKQPQIIKIKFDCHKQQQQSDLLESYQFEHYFLYLFVKNKVNTSNIVLYKFKKQDGSHSKLVLSGISTHISSAKLMLCYTKPLLEFKKGENPQTYLKILIGTIDGHLKILKLQKPFNLTTIKIDNKPIKMIIQADYTRFNNQNICAALDEGSTIYFIDLDREQLVYILKPTLIMCDRALSITFDSQFNHLMQCTEGGYIIFWKMEKIIQQLRIRDAKKNKQSHQGRKFWIYPFCVDHSMSIQGLIWCQFYGNLVILITKEGMLKIFAYIFVPENQFIQLLSFKISNPETISHVMLFADQDMLLVAKNKDKDHIIEKIKWNQELRVVKVVRIFVDKIGFIQQFYVNKHFDILICQGKQCFVLNQCYDLLEEERKKQYQRQY